MRLLDYLLEHDLVPDERTGRGLIMRGDVLVDERPVTSAAAEVSLDSRVRVRGDQSGAVSRGVAKLAGVAKRLGFDCEGRIALDLGVGSGGFTQVLLAAGAARVYAVDVAYGMVAMGIRDDRRVVLLERTNARKLTREQVPEPIERMVGDLSFISWAAVLPAVVPLLGPEARLLLLVKPQFELAARGRDDLVAGGVVRDAAAVEDCLTGLYNTWQAHALAPRAVVPAGVRGAKGNQEYFVLLERGETTIEAEYQAIVRQALAEVTE